MDHHIAYDVPALVRLVRHHTRATEVTWIGWVDDDERGVLRREQVVGLRIANRRAGHVGLLVKVLA